VVVATRKIPFLDMKLKKAYAEIASDIQGSNGEEKDNYLIKPLLPEPVILMIKNQFEKKMRLPESGPIS
jgi:hypothetical protein